MKTVLMAGVLWLGISGCGVSNDPRDESEPTASETSAESELTVCEQWFCVAVRPGTDCKGYGIAGSKGRCQADALNDCKAHCGGFCVIESITCDFPP